MRGPIQIAIIEFPGTNCEQETAEAVRRAGMVPVVHRWNMDYNLLSGYHGYIIAGGFSYEDRSRSGVIAAQDPVMQTIRRESEQGKPVLGICNGAQILVESGLVPGIEGYQLGAALAHNRRIRDGRILGTGFYNAWVSMTCSDDGGHSAFTQPSEGNKLIRLPAAHAEGRFLFTPGLLDELERRQMISFTYVDSNGLIDPEFPANPNGSEGNCAGITNAGGNIMALMPHPERTPAGDAVFDSMRTYIESKKPFTPVFLPSSFAAGTAPLQRYACPDDAGELSIELIITDNAAVSVEQSLRAQGIAASVTRRTHWEIVFDRQLSPDQRKQVIEQISATGELFNPNKEQITAEKQDAGRSILVREIEDSVGEHALHALSAWFSITGIEQIRHGTLWQVIPDDLSRIDTVMKQVEQTHLLSHPIAHRSMLYEV